MEEDWSEKGDVVVWFYMCICLLTSKKYPFFCSLVNIRVDTVFNTEIRHYYYT